MRHARLLFVLVCAFCGGIDGRCVHVPAKRRESTAHSSPRVRASAVAAATRSLTFTETMVAGAVSRSIAQTAMQPANVIKVTSMHQEWCQTRVALQCLLGLTNLSVTCIAPTLLQTLLQGKSTASQYCNHTTASSITNITAQKLELQAAHTRSRGSVSAVTAPRRTELCHARDCEGLH
eukprot:7328-Heterococcus_DN1.PRE.2